ncbi:FliC/FljB family flagellin [Citrobacter portucalensis]|uniref:FliC/FljB family flagellin n=2 Tax=Citrobacter portucalensis TaxID=1639133 RepID=UPI0018D05318|nr:FliC/FljB family flagellin [Citrobacter portucalensis]MDT7464464.1 FliC/FljB family flagellin [Citrobacter portucalensis]QPO96831.1 FliC/FljB family flagellin [Citrobacter freundii]
MAQVINTNSLSLLTQNNLNKSQSSLSSAIERLSSGLRINSAKDDAAGQAIANRFTANIKGLTQASRNANDGISIAQTTEGALSEINNNLQRVRELSVQATNGSNSQSDLDSIQNEITQRLSEIDRVSGQTQFNGVKVLSQDNSLKIQVGANDGETITIDLKKITSDTLGLNGFNVNGKGSVANKAATVSDLTAAGATGAGPYVVTTKNAALTSEDAIAQMKTGDTVITTGTSGATYTYNKESDSFTTKATVADGDVATFANTLKPAAGTTVSGVYTRSTGTVNFEADANGNITVDGKKAFIAADGNLTTNDAGTPPAATISTLFANGSTVAVGGSVKLGDTTYDFGAGAASGFSYTKTVSKDAVLSDINASAAANAALTGATVNYSSGIQTGTATFGGANTNGAGKALTTYVDADKELTTVAQFNTSYAVDKDTGAVTVSGGTGTGKYAADIGAKAYVSADGKLTTKNTSVGTSTKDPLAALDKALAQVDALRSDLGAVQNRFDSTITNLGNTVNNLSSARSRIEDADYATEVSNMSRAQILQQAGTSVLAQANQTTQNVLSLLR